MVSLVARPGDPPWYYIVSTLPAPAHQGGLPPGSRYYSKYIHCNTGIARLLLVHIHCNNSKAHLPPKHGIDAVAF